MRFNPILLTISVLVLGADFIPSTIAQRRQKATEIEFLWPSGATNTVLFLTTQANRGKTASNVVRTNAKVNDRAGLNGV